MNTGGRLVAGSHNRNEFVLINADEIGRIKSVRELSGQTCQICGDEVEITVDGELFVACNECAFRLVGLATQYERKEGNRVVLNAKPDTSASKDEDDIDDLEHEFDYGDIEASGFAQSARSLRLQIIENAIIVPPFASWNGIHPIPPGTTKTRKLLALHSLFNFGHNFIQFTSFVLVNSRPMVPEKDIALYGYGSVAWKDRMEEWKKRQNDKLQVVKHQGNNDGGDFDGSELDPDLPMMDEGGSHFEEITYCFKQDKPVRKKEESPRELADIDVFHKTIDPMKEPPPTSQTRCSPSLRVDYPVDKFNIEPRSEWYFSREDGLSERQSPSAFVRERRAMKREYEEFKVQINRLVAMAEKVPEEGWTMQDGTPWPGNNVRDHPGMIQVFLGHDGVRDIEGNELPRLVYVSREKRPGFEHHKKAGAMNSLIRVSAVLSNAPYLLNVDCDHYINNSKALREAMCFMMDPTSGKKVCYVQFPQRFDGIDRHDRYSNRNVVFFDINMKGLDGLQGPIYVGTGKGKTKKDKKKSKHREASKQIHALETIEEGIEENGGVLEAVNSTSLLKEAIHVISCGYEDKTEWGKEVGWIYGSVTEDILTGFKMHCHGWRSVYCMPKRPAFKGSAPINLSDRLHQVLRWALGSVEIFLSKHCPIWYGYGGGLKWLERFSYINSVVYPWTSIPLIVYCTLPAICLLTGKFIVPEISNYASIIFMALFISIAATGILEMQWGGVGIDDWWRNEQFWVIGGVSSHFFALLQGLLKVLAGVSTNFTVTSKGGDDGDFAELYIFKWTSLLIPPTTLLIVNIIGVVVGISDAVNNGYDSWGPLFGKLFFAFWVIMHLYPFLKGLIGKQDRVPTVIVIWSILISSILTLVWVRINPFVSREGPILEICGLDCDD
ncbi:hypothetical protein DH2020_015484 [Rehmannia glutinosa]|uniref:Cellulose synthase n=1 Tax=Rehmannia glutinosa TaxID=99300 RepID=A0ABR0WW33_REHGL